MLSDASLAQPASGSSLAAIGPPSLEEVKSCMNIAKGAECLDNLFREALKTHSTAEILQLIQRAEAEDADVRRDCPIRSYI